jgi:hypothetical protein
LGRAARFTNSVGQNRREGWCGSKEAPGSGRCGRGAARRGERRERFPGVTEIRSNSTAECDSVNSICLPDKGPRASRARFSTATRCSLRCSQTGRTAFRRPAQSACLPGKAHAATSRPRRGTGTFGLASRRSRKVRRCAAGLRWDCRESARTDSLENRLHRLSEPTAFV